MHPIVKKFPSLVGVMNKNKMNNVAHGACKKAMCMG
jgi:hypothetical protein